MKIMKRIKVKIFVFSILTVFIYGLLTLMIIGITLIPTVRKYTVTNNTNEVVYITPFIQFGVSADSMEEEWDDLNKMKEYIKQVDNFSILSQYSSYSPPTLPTFKRKDIKVNPNSKVVLYINYDELKQEGGPQILLIKDNQNNYFYKDADFWESDIIMDKNSLQIASKNILETKEKSNSSLRSWFLIISILIVILLFPYLLIKNIVLLKKEKKANLQHFA